jgi:AmmeMemoRadiSam system protein B
MTACNVYFLKMSVFTAMLAVAGAAVCANGGEPVVRRPARAGQFYPGTKASLSAAVDSYIEKVPARESDAEILAAVVPHAGYQFSAGVASYVFKAITNVQFETIVIIGHDCGAGGGVALVCDVDFYETPLGRVPVDTGMVRKLIAYDPGIRAERRIHAQEHTVEVQLPFLQRAGREFSVVPVLFGDPTIRNCKTLAEAISAAAGSKKVFVLSSTDMTHYPPYDDAVRIDGATLETVRAFDVEKLFKTLEAQERANPGLRTAMCSRGGVGTAMLFARKQGADAAEVLHYANSGDVQGGDKNGVVGYGAVLFVKSPRGK